MDMDSTKCTSHYEVLCRLTLFQNDPMVHDTPGQESRQFRETRRPGILNGWPYPVTDELLPLVCVEYRR